MVSVARKNLFHEKARLAIGVLGISLAIVLILLIDGFSNSLYEQVTIYYENLDADLIVSQSGSEGMFVSISALPATADKILRRLRGVDRVSSVLVAPVMFVEKGEKTPILLVGSDPGATGSPWKLAEGRTVKQDSEVVLDKALALRNGLKPGDFVKILGQEFKVVGLSLETASWMSPLVFITRKAAGKIMSAEDSVSYFLLKLSQGTSVSSIKRRVKAEIPHSQVLTTESMALKERKIMVQLMGNSIGVMTSVAFIIGVLVVGLTIYTVILERIKEYGILKAIGASNRWLYQLVIAQSLLNTFLGFIGGVLLAIAAARLIEQVSPQFLISIEAFSILKTCGLAFIMALVACLSPARRIAYVEPSAVFRS